MVAHNLMTSFFSKETSITSSLWVKFFKKIIDLELKLESLQLIF